MKWGERLSPREGELSQSRNIEMTLSLFINISVDQIFREANISPNGMVKYEEFVKIVCAPVPDYY